MKRWPLQKAHFWEKAPFFRLLLPLIAGILLYPLWTGSNTVALFTAFFAYLLFITTALFKTQEGLKQIATFLSLHGLLIFFAFSICYFNDVRNNKHWFGHHVNTADLSLVRIANTPHAKESVWKLEVDVLQTLTPQNSFPSVGKAYVYVNAESAPKLSKGDTLLLPNNWEVIKNPGNPHEFDYSRYCARNNLFYRQFVPCADVLVKGKVSPHDLSFTEAAHDICMSILGHHINNWQATGLVQSMLIGDEVNLDPELRDTFSETGIVHVIAISGGNIAVLFMLVLLLLRWLRHKKYHWLKYAIALPLVWFYVIMAGASPSAVRAAVMFSLLALGFMLQKRIDTNSLNHLFATAFILLAANPMWLYAIGFQLSFIAVLSLILFYRHIYRWYSPTNWFTKGLWSTIAASLSAEMLIFPIIIYYFHIFPLWFIVSNVLAYLLLGIVLIMGMSIIASSFIPGVAKFLGSVVALVVKLFVGLIGLLSHFEPRSFHTLRLNAPGLILTYLFIACFATYLLHKKLNALLLAMATACLLLISFCINAYTDSQQDRLVVYNAGKAVHIEHVTGNTSSILYSSGLLSPKKEFLLTRPHIMWQALIRPHVNDEFLTVAGKKVLILEKAPLKTASTFPVDELILAYNPQVKDLPLLKSTFHPQKIILTRALPRPLLTDWKIMARNEGIALHPVQNGAYILE